MSTPRRGPLAFAVPVAVVGIVLLLVVPVPALLLDMLLAANITAALLILMTSMYVKRPLDFSVFPSILLVFTLFRLGLNVASTRLVLRDGHAGKVIDAFGEFVVGGSLVIGLVIFLILVVIQFAVITNGATRVAEVGARFTLDAMPGKQMAIDADLNAGLIDENEARTRRAEIAAEADFYGAMDGSSKFVKGDAIAGVVITLINLIGGFAIGMLTRDMSASEALSTYSLLSVGDGLVSQIPALLLSVSTGIIVTRATTQGDLGSDAAVQLGQNRTALFIAGGAALTIAIVPGMPKIPFILVGGILVAAGFAGRQTNDDEVIDIDVDDAAEAVNPDAPEQLIQQMRVDPLEIVLAPDLVDLVDPSSGGDLLDRVRALRRKVAMEVGIVVPPVRTRDSIDNPAHTYIIRISGVEVTSGTAPSGKVLALGDYLDGLPGEPTTDPVFGIDGKWVPAELRHQAELAGATVVDRASVLVTHLSEVVRTHAAKLLTREDTRALVESVKAEHPALIEELTPTPLSLGEVQAVLQGLLEENVAIRNLPHIFEGLSMRAKTSTEVPALIEAGREVLGPAIAAPYVESDTLNIITMAPALEHAMAEALRPGENGPVLALDPKTSEQVITQLGNIVTQAETQGINAVLAVAPALRPAVRALTVVGMPRLAVLSYTEVGASKATINTIGFVSGHDALVS